MTRWLCDHCEAVVQTQGPTESGTDLFCGACRRRFQGSSTTTLNQAAPTHRDVSSQNILLAAVEVLRQHGMRLIGVSLIVNVVWFVVVGGGGRLLQSQYAQASDGTGNAIGWGFLVLFACIAPFVFAIVSAYAMIVIVRMSLSLVRPGENHAAPLGSALRSALSVPLKPLCRVGTVLLVAGIVVAGTTVVGLVITVLLSLFIEPTGATLTGTIITGVLLFLIVFLLQWLLWPVIFFIADERTDLLHGVRWGLRIAWQHRKLTVFLITVYFVLSTFGALAAYVGQAFTTPIAMLPLAIGYLRMTGGQGRE